jgi:hypothetical protein
MSKRAGPPLFELLRQRSEEPAAPPTQRRDPDPAVPWTGAGVTRAERSAAALDDEPRPAGELRVPMTRVYMAIAVTMLFLVGAWAAGYYFGVKDGKAQLDRVVGGGVGEQPVVLPPVATNETGTRTSPPGQPVNQPTNPASTNNPGLTPAGITPAPAGSPWVLALGGVRAVDPRVQGSNYLALATLPPDQTLDAITFLDAKGLRAVGVPVDSGGRSANNPARYTLISLGLAVPSGQFNSTVDQRRAHEALVRTLGSEWQRAHRGGSDFSQTQWIRYNP